MSTDRRVLVTGATGFLGRPAVNALIARGFDVHGVARSGAAPLPAGATLHALDLHDPGATAALVEGLSASHLLHLAWTVAPGQFWTDPANLDWVASSLALTRAFTENGGRRAVFVGTCAEYDWSFHHLREGDTPLRPQTLYGAAKLGLSAVVDGYSRQTGLAAAWARMFFLYGPHEAPRRLVSDVCAGLIAAETVACSEGTQQRDFMHVDDAGAALAAIVDSDWRGAVNVASGRTVAVREVIAKLGRLAGHPELIAFGARPSNPGEPAILAASTEILNTSIGFRPYYNLDDGLAQTLEWWRGGRRRDAGGE